MEQKHEKKHEGEGQQFIVTKENQRERCKKGNHWNQLITQKLKIEANFLWVKIANVIIVLFYVVS